VIDARLGDLVAPLRAAPARSALLLDVDGTLAPITRHASETTVPAATRALLEQLAGRYGLVACITGRRTRDARAIVGLDGLAYVGNHGTESLPVGAEEPEVRPEVAAWEDRVRETARRLVAGVAEAADLGIWIEDKGAIQALHWRGSDAEARADAVAAGVGAQAEAEGLVLHRGRMVLELRPPVPFDKGAAVRWLLADRDLDGGLYAGDDRTDIDAFDGLRAMRDEGRLDHAVCVAAADPGSPAEVSAAADVVVPGTDGVRALLQELVRA
jgi:trehalose-phosphatase